MRCPHCNEDLRYKERGGRRCSKCKREFAFEPKTDPLGLHDKRFLKAVAKLSADGKLYFTAGQLLHFLSRNRTKNSFSAVRGWLIFLTVASIVASVILFSTPAIYLTAPAAVLFAVLSAAFWRKEGDLKLPLGASDFQKKVLGRWNEIYKSPFRLLNGDLPAQNSQNFETARAAIVCADDEILRCLAANRINKKFDLILLDLSPRRQSDAEEKSKIQRVNRQKDLPLLVLHDASIEGCLMKDEFVRIYLGGDSSSARPVFDIGLRPNDVINAKVVRLRRKDVSANSTQNLSGLDPAEIEWLANGNYTPLVALAPAQLIRLVENGVKRYGAPPRAVNRATEKRRASDVGFMTWLGE